MNRWLLAMAGALTLVAVAGILPRAAVAADTGAGATTLTRGPVDGARWVPTAARLDARTEHVYVAEGDGGGGGGGDLAKQLQNPVADLISVPIQANLDQGYGPEDHAYQWTINVQPVIPIKLNCRWNVISRTILPVIVQEGRLPGQDDAVGLGDTVQSLFFSPRDAKGLIWGVGPVFLLPTATEDRLGAKKWGVGPTAVVLKQQGPWTIGFLGNHIWSFADAGTRSDTLEDPEVNATFLQPFVSYTFPSAFSLTVNTESTYDWENETWNVPINVFATQVTKICRQPVSLGLGFRYWAETPDGGPEWGIRLIWTFLFPK